MVLPSQPSTLKCARFATLLIIWLAVSRGASARRLPNKKLASQPQPQWQSQSSPQALPEAQTPAVHKTPLESSEAVSMVQTHKSQLKKTTAPHAHSKRPDVQLEPQLESPVPTPSPLNTKALPHVPAEAVQWYATVGAISAKDVVTTSGTLTLALEKSALTSQVASVLAPVFLAIVALLCAQSGRAKFGSRAKHMPSEENSNSKQAQAQHLEPTERRQCADKSCPACSNGYIRGAREPEPEPGTTVVSPRPPSLSRSGSLLCLDGELAPYPEQRTMAIKNEDGVTILRAVVDDVGPNPNIRVETVDGTAPMVILDTRHTDSRLSNRHVVLHRVGTAFDDPGVPCACLRPAGGGTYTLHHTAGPGLDEKRVALTVVTAGSASIIDSMMDDKGLVARRADVMDSNGRDVSARSDGRSSWAVLWVRHGADVALVASLALATQKLG